MSFQVRPSFIFRTQIKIFLMKSESFLSKVGQKNVKSSSVKIFIHVYDCFISACKQGVLLLHKQHHAHDSWYCCECKLKTDMEENLNKVLFFANKKYSRSFISLSLNQWCHMDYYINVLTTFLGLERISCVAVYAGMKSTRISSKIS